MSKSFGAKIFILLTVLILILCGCSKTQELTAKPPEVIVSKVWEKKINDSMTVVGEVKSLNKVQLRARVKGFLINRNFEEGAFVDKGELLFQIEKDQYESQVETAKAAVMTAEANLKNRMIDFERQDYLMKRDAIPQKNYDLATCAKEIAEAKVMSAKAQLEEAKLNLSYTDIYSPLKGRIGLAKYSVGNVVDQTSNPLALVTQLDPIGVEFNLNESLIIGILQYIENNEKKHPLKNGEHIGIKYIDVKLLLSNKTEYNQIGKIDFLDNQINPMTGTILVRAVFKNSNSILIPGAYVNVKIESKYKTNRLLIQQAAIQEDQTGTFVLLVDDKNQVEKRNIKTGSIYGIYIVVDEGLKLDEKVIVEGLQKVREGMTVSPVEDENEEKEKASLNLDDNVDKTNKSADANLAQDPKQTSEQIKKLKDKLVETDKISSSSESDTQKNSNKN